MTAASLAVAIAVAACACQGSNAASPAGSIDGGGTDSGSSGNSGGDAGGSDAGTSPTMPQAIRAFDGAVEAAVHAGTSWYVGGAFTRATPYAANGLVQLDPAGNPLDCVADAGTVSAIAVAGGSVYLATNTYRGAAVDGIAKIDATTCALDTTFDAGLLNVYALAIANNALYAGGGFTSYRGTANAANGIAKLDLATGNLDTTFSPPGVDANGFGGESFSGLLTEVSALAVSGTSLYVGGDFTSYRGVANAANALAKLDLTSGAIDTTFDPPGASSNGFGTYSRVVAFAVSGSSLYVGGGFSAYRGVASSASSLAKVDLASGALDTAFSPPGAGANGFNGEVLALAIDGTSLYVGGRFSAYRGIASSALDIAKLDLSSGVLDTAFSPAAANGFDYASQGQGSVIALAVSNGALFVGGQFKRYRAVAGAANNLVKLDLATGDLVPYLPAGSTYPGVDGRVSSLVEDGANLWVGGTFTSYAGHQADHIAKLDDTTLALDTTFSPPAANGFFHPYGSSLPFDDASVYALAVAGSSLYVGGHFTDYRGVANAANYLAKLDLETGALDTTFSSPGATANGTDGDVHALAASDTSLYVGGAFNGYRSSPGETTMVNASGLAKLDLASGALDATFSPLGAGNNGVDGTVYALALDGTSLYVGGSFLSYRGTSLSAVDLAKLDETSGTLDTTFTESANGFEVVPCGDLPCGPVSALAVAGTSLYVGGYFNTYRGSLDAADNLAKLDLASGALDTTFSPPGAGNNGFSASVTALVADSSALYVGGTFTAYRGVASSANYIAKLDLADGALDTTFSPPGGNANGFDLSVQALATSSTSLFVGGGFQRYRGTTLSVRAAVLDPASGAAK